MQAFIDWLVSPISTPAYSFLLPAPTLCSQISLCNHSVKQNGDGSQIKPTGLLFAAFIGLIYLPIHTDCMVGDKQLQRSSPHSPTSATRCFVFSVCTACLNALNHQAIPHVLHQIMFCELVPFNWWQTD